MSDPTKIVIDPQDVVPYIRNDGGSVSVEAAWWRCQRCDPTMRRGITTHFQLGSKDATGTTVGSPEYTIALEHHMHDMSAELVMAGKTPGVDTSYTLGDVLTQDDLRVNLLERTVAGAARREYEFDDGLVATLTWAFTVQAPSTVTSEIRAKLGKLYRTSGSLPHDSYPTDTTSTPGAVLGKDARIWFGTDVAGDRAYRLQSFNVRGAFPVDVVRELGRRAIVGIMSRQPTVTVDFDILTADQQPHDVWFATVGGSYIDFGDAQVLDIFIRLYDPDLAEANTVLRAWKLENAQAGDLTPMSISVGGQPATRYTLQLGKPDTADSCGVTAYLGDIV